MERVRRQVHQGLVLAHDTLDRSSGRRLLAVRGPGPVSQAQEDLSSCSAASTSTPGSRGSTATTRACRRGGCGWSTTWSTTARRCWCGRRWAAARSRCRTWSRRRSARSTPRLRFYGFVNDSEFIAECQKHGIKVFGIVFEVQGWEFPVELNEAEDSVLALNELRGVGKRDWLGLREFSQNRYPKLWPPFEHYFPGGLVNSDGEPVTDLHRGVRRRATSTACLPRALGGVPRPRALVLLHGPQQPGLARVPEGGHPHPDRRRRRRHPARRGRAADGRASSTAAASARTA